MRMARLYAAGVAVTYGVLVVLASGDGAARAGRALVIRELTAASWVVTALAALSLAANLREQDVQRGFGGLLAQRGIRDDALELGRWLAGAKRIATLVGLSGLFVCAVAAMRVGSLQSGLLLLARAIATVVYSLLLGAGISALARAAASLAPRHGRSLLIALVLLPHAARELWPELPSVPAAYGSLLSLVARVGGIAS